MMLSLKQIAIFGQVFVNVNALNSTQQQYITLLELYRKGWWVTERVGTVITLVKPRKRIKDGFCCVCKRISTGVNLSTLDLLTQKIADAKYEEYKKILQPKTKYDKVKENKERYENNNMPSLLTRNKVREQF